MIVKMTTWFIIIGFALSSSIDNLGVGLTYGIRRIRIGIGQNTLIAFVCFLLSIIGISFGKWMAVVLPGILPAVVGAFLLIIIGIRIVLIALPRRQQYSEVVEGSGSQQISVTSILKNPERADLDQSGTIGWAESIFLGIALSANALTNGLGAGLLGFSPFAISITAAIGSFMTVWIGVALGERVADIRIGSFSLGQFGTIISGILLVIIAINAFLF